MSARRCTAEEFAAALLGELIAYQEEVTEKVKEAVDIVADEVNREIKGHVTFNQRTRKYLKAFRIKRSAAEGRYNRKNVWYVAAPYYRLTHLLEKGHAMPHGGRDARAFPHIKYGEELAQRRMVELSEEAVRG